LRSAICARSLPRLSAKTISACARIIRPGERASNTDRPVMAVCFTSRSDMKPPGRVVLGIRRAFRAEPGRALTTRQLWKWTHPRETLCRDAVGVRTSLGRSQKLPTRLRSASAGFGRRNHRVRRRVAFCGGSASSATAGKNSSLSRVTVGKLVQF
jgi:hypothetical protein